MINKKKSKIIIGSMAGLMAISLASVGFGEWAIGLVNKETNSTITVNVDTYKEETAYINVDIDEANNSLFLGEYSAKQTADGSSVNGIGYKVVTDNPSKLDIKMKSFVMAISQANLAKFKGLKFVLTTANEGNSLTKTIEANDKFGRIQDSNLSYLGFVQEINLTSLSDDTANKYFNVKPVDGKYNVYTLKDEYLTLHFWYGSLFGNTDVASKTGIVSPVDSTTSGNYKNSPVDYYQDKIDKATGATETEKLENKLGMLSQIQKDMDSMKTDLSGANLNLKITFDVNF